MKVFQLILILSLFFGVCNNSLAHEGFHPKGEEDRTPSSTNERKTETEPSTYDNQDSLNRENYTVDRYDRNRGEPEFKKLVSDY